MKKAKRKLFQEVVYAARMSLQGVQQELTDNGTRGASAISEAIHDTIRAEGASSFRADSVAESVRASLRNTLNQVENARINLEYLARALDQAELAVEEGARRR